MPTWIVTGTAHYADGFEFEIEADTEVEARLIAFDHVAQETGGYRFDPEPVETVIEICKVKD